MLFHPTPTDPDQDDQQAEDAQLYRAVLHELIHIGTDLARLTHQHAVAHARAAMQGAFPDAPPQDHAAAFGHIARAIRRCVTLARSLHEPPPRARHPAGQGAAPRPRPFAGTGDATPAPSAAARDDSADASATEPHDHPEVRDRDAPDRDDDVTGRPPAEVIAEIRRDLGLDAPSGAAARTRGTPTDRPPAEVERPGTQAATSTGAAPSSPRHPGPHPGPGAAQRPSSPAQARPDQPAPTHPVRTLPDHWARADATVPRHSGRTEARWRPPPAS